jgi:hypothetical protein
MDKAGVIGQNVKIIHGAFSKAGASLVFDDP